MKVIDPVAARIFGVVPGSVRLLVFGRILESLLSQLDVGLIMGVEVRAYQQTRTQRVCVMNLTVQARYVTDAEPVFVRIFFIIAKYMFAGAHCDL